MARRRKSFRSNTVSTREWLSFKPYDSISNYDLPYLGICNQVLKVLNAHQSFFQEARLNDEDVRILTVILVSHFEDFINEIGIWSAFRKINRELYGYYIPFYDLSGYGDEFLNPEDIALLIWAFCSTQAGELFHAPDRPEILQMAYEVYELLDTRIDSAPATDFYHKFFYYSSRPDFFELKEKLQWLALGSYFFAPFFLTGIARKLENPSDILMEAFADDPSKLLYTIQEDYIYDKRAPLSAVSAPEMLARLLDCPEAVREDVLRFHRRPTAMFYLEKEDDRYYYLQLPSTGRVFPVRKDSVGHGKTPLEADHFHFVSLIQWKGEWLFTGVISTWQSQKGMMEEMKKAAAPTPYVFDSDQIARTKEQTQLMNEVFVELFGRPFVILEDGKALADAMEKFNEAYTSEVVARNEEARKFKEEHPEIGPKRMDLEKHFPNRKGLGLFFVPGHGIEMFSSAGELSDLLQADRELSQEEKSHLFFGLMSDHFSADSTQLLLNAYSDRNLALPFPASSVDVRRDWQFLLRFFKPQDFGEKLPSMSLISSEHFK